MTFEISSPPYRPEARPGSVIGLLDTMPGAVLVGAALLLALTFGKAIAVWQTGMFFGPDDAMRASEVRDFLAGQGWYDLVPRRMSPNHPFVMHWSRLADLPLAAMMQALRTVTDADTAERVTRLIQPAGLFILLLVVLVGLARDLCGRGGSLAVALLAAGSLDIVSDVMPGRIHHHALQLLLLAVMTKQVCDGLDPQRSARMVGAGAVAALSLAINLQNMPFVLAAAALIGLIWAGQGVPCPDRSNGSAWGWPAAPRSCSWPRCHRTATSWGPATPSGRPTFWPPASAGCASRASAARRAAWSARASGSRPWRQPAGARSLR